MPARAVLRPLRVLRPLARSTRATPCTPRPYRDRPRSSPSGCRLVPVAQGGQRDPLQPQRAPAHARRHVWGSSLQGVMRGWAGVDGARPRAACTPPCPACLQAPRRMPTCVLRWRARYRHSAGMRALRCYPSSRLGLTVTFHGTMGADTTIPVLPAPQAPSNSKTKQQKSPRRL